MPYEHLKPDEKVIAKASIAKGIFKLPNMKFDVHIGKGFESNFEATEKEREMFKRLTQKRIDAIEENNNIIKIIEFTPRISARTIGNLIAYKSILKKEIDTRKTIELWLITSDVDKELLELVKELKINLREV